MWMSAKTIHTFIVETPIPKAKRSGIGKLNNPAKRRVLIPRSLLRNLFPKLALEFIPVIFFMAFFLLGTSAFAQELKLSDLTEEALKNSPEIQASLSKIEAARYRIPQAKSLPDPMLTFGYQNEGFDRYT